MFLNRNFTNALLDGDRRVVRAHLEQFKVKGRVDYESVMTVPHDARINWLTSTKKGKRYATVVLSVVIQSAMNSLNLKHNLNEDQIIDIAEAIIDDSHDDNLSFEDVVLFLSQLITGKVGKLYDRMDVPKFFESFEVYRQERHATYQRVKDENHSRHKSDGPRERSSEDLGSIRDKHSEAMNINSFINKMYRR